MPKVDRDQFLDVLELMNEKMNTMLERLEDVQRVCISIAEDTSENRTRQIEEASRNGQVQHHQQRSIQEIDARVRKLETA